MYKKIFLIYLLGHVVGEFYIQKKSENAQTQKIINIKHNFLYFVAMIICIIPVLSYELLGAACIIAISHLFIDAIVEKMKRVNGCKTNTLRNVFIVEQVIQIGIIAAVTMTIVCRDVAVAKMEFFSVALNLLNISGYKIITWLVGMLIIHRPANIFIGKVLAVIKPDDQGEEFVIKRKKEYNVGRTIGSLERMIMLIFMSIGQYSSIGLVMTAKSIARFDKISKNQDFAEYYLLGTLLSVAVVICVSFLL